MAAGQPITVAVSIGDPLTGTIKGSTVVAAPTTGNNPINIDQVVSLATTPTRRPDDLRQRYRVHENPGAGIRGDARHGRHGDGKRGRETQGGGQRSGRRHVYPDAHAGIAQRRGFCRDSRGRLSAISRRSPARRRPMAPWWKSLAKSTSRPKPQPG